MKKILGIFLLIAAYVHAQPIPVLKNSPNSAIIGPIYFVNPASIIYTPAGNSTVIDFGLAGKSFAPSGDITFTYSNTNPPDGTCSYVRMKAVGGDKNFTFPSGTIDLSTGSAVGTVSVTSGLTKEYIVQYIGGVFETFNLVGSGGSGGSAAFSALTSGTNTQAVMLVGNGASIDTAGSGTINSSTLLGSTWASPPTIGGTAPGVVNGLKFYTTPVSGTTGTTNAISVGEAIKFATFVNATTTTLTLPVSPAANDYFDVYLNGCNGTATLTTSATVYRAGDSSSGTVFTPNQVSSSNAKHRMRFWYDGTNWWEADTFTSAVNLAGTGSGGVTGVLGGGNLPHSVSFSITGGGSPLQTGVQDIIVSSQSGGTLTAWSVTVSPADTITLDILRSADGGAAPSTSIVGGSGTKPNVASGVNSHSTTFTSWTSTTVSAYDNFKCQITAVGGTATSATVTLYFQ